jgi:hypothetical protein
MAKKPLKSIRPYQPKVSLSAARVAAIVDKGAEKGALAVIERTISEAQTGQTIATVKSTAFMRNVGGFGGPSGLTPELHQLPTRAPDPSHAMRRRFPKPRSSIVCPAITIHCTLIPR